MIVYVIVRWHVVDRETFIGVFATLEAAEAAKAKCEAKEYESPKWVQYHIRDEEVQS